LKKHFEIKYTPRSVSPEDIGQMKMENNGSNMKLTVGGQPAQKHRSQEGAKILIIDNSSSGDPGSGGFLSKRFNR